MYSQKSTALCSVYVKLFFVLTIPNLHLYQTITTHLQYLCNQKRSPSLPFYSLCFYGTSARFQQWPLRCRDFQTIGFYEVTMSVPYKPPHVKNVSIDELKLVSRCSKRRYLIRGWWSAQYVIDEKNSGTTWSSSELIFWKTNHSLSTYWRLQLLSQNYKGVCLRSLKTLEWRHSSTHLNL
jgi:hypothetical protein